MTIAHTEAFTRGFAADWGEPPADERQVPADWDQLASPIMRAVDTGRSAFPGLHLDAERFVAFLGACVRKSSAAAHALPPAAEVIAFMNRLFVADLYLVCAAGMGDGEAVEKVIDLLRPKVAAACRGGDPPAFVDDVTQVLRQKLLVPGDETPPKLLSFSGQAPFSAWLGVVVDRTVQTLRRSEGTRERFERLAAIEAEVIDREPELAYIKKHYAEAFGRAFEHALRKLSDRERSLLRLHNVHGTTLQQLAAVYAVDDSTISRWLARARNLLLEETGRYMRDVVSVSASEFPSLARALASQVTVSLNRWLLSGTTPGSSSR